MRTSHTMPFGATLLADGGTLFRLWAPIKGNVSLVLKRPHGDVVIDCDADTEGWRQATVPDAVAGERYQWRVPCGVDGRQIDVPDPASRSNPQGPHQASVVLDPQAFEWQEGWHGRPWEEAICYEMHMGTFTPEGTFDAARERLPALARLGITCLQIMPLATFAGQFGWGYDGVLSYAPHAAYGPPEALKAFIRAAHELGMMVMLDVVYNHFGPDGNYLPVYAPGFFTERHHTPWGAGINFDGPQAAPVRDFFVHNSLYWLTEYQFDGLRFDAVHAMADDTRPDIMEEISHRVRARCPGRHVHLVLENDFNDARRLVPGEVPGRFDAQWSGDFHHTLHVLLTGEKEGYYAEYAQQPLPMLAHALTHGFAMEGAPHLADEAARKRHPRRTATTPVPLNCVLNFLQNHDQVGNRAFGERLTMLLPEAPLRLAVAMLLLNPATPMLFMGEEHGAVTPFLYFADWSGELRRAVTAGRRKEFAHFSAFADPHARERIPDPCNRATFEQSKLDWASFDTPAARRWHRLYTELIGLRRAALQPMLHHLTRAGHRAHIQGRLLSVQWLFEPHAGAPAQWLHMAVNLGDAPATVDPMPVHARVLFETSPCDTELPAWAGRWHWAEARP